MSTYEPLTVFLQLKTLELPQNQKKFTIDWENKVKSRVEDWAENRKRSKQSCNRDQLKWEAEIVEYVNYLHSKTKARSGSVRKPLDKEIPLFGPKFMPPTLLQHLSRHTAAQIEPSMSYLKPLTIVHPFYFPEFSCCPNLECKSKDTTWNGWTGSGAREVHGLFCEERALGFQIMCKICKAKVQKKKAQMNEDEREGKPIIQAYTAMTSPEFWEGYQHWEIPAAIPLFFKRCAVTRELQNLIIEIRPSLTSGGLAEHIKQLHLFEYHKNRLAYVNAYKTRGDTPFQPLKLKQFSDPLDPEGYNDIPITDDQITEIFCEFNDFTRREESAEYLRTLTGRVLSFDHTFKTARKASIVTSEATRLNPLTGGLFDVINENLEIIAWRYCQSQANNEINEVLQGLKCRYTELGLDDPEMIVADNCCHIASAVAPVFPKTKVCLDVYHLIKRYTSTILNGQKNSRYSIVAADITDAILKVRAKNSPNGMAEYWDQEEQKQRLQAVFEKWSVKGGIWNSTAASVHAEQMKHVNKGCLARTRNDIHSDGSRIEGTHKGWNSLQRAQPSGLIMMTALGNDFVLRRNIRAWLRWWIRFEDSRPMGTFLEQMFGSHHIRLVNRISETYNTIVSKQINKVLNKTFSPLPTLQAPKTNEQFGLVRSEHALTFGGLFTIKTEFDDDVTPGAEMDEDLVLEMEPGMPTAFPEPTMGLETVASNIHESISTEFSTSDETSTSTPTANLSIDLSKLIVMDVEPDAEAAPVTERSSSKRKMSIPNSSSTLVSTGNVSSSLVPDPPSKKLRQSSELYSEDPTKLKKDASLSLHPFFQHTQLTTTGPSHQFSNPISPQSLALKSKDDETELITPLPLPNLPSNSSEKPKMSRSQVFFQLHAKLHPDSLLIKGDDQFFLFMDMRAEQHWVSFSMSPSKWVEATNAYNQRLQALQPNAVLKIPHTLLKKLMEVETIIQGKLAKNDLTSHNGQGSDVFWTRHCNVVSLTKPGNNTPSSRKQAICQRCGRLQYPGLTNSPENHKRGVCSDGVPQKSKVIPYPQPDGLFTKRKNEFEFHPLVFLQKVRELYLLIITNGQSSGAQIMPMWYWSFSELFSKHMKQTEGGFFFELSWLGEVKLASGAPDSILLTVDGVQCLRVHSLA